jgi:hypothetical protein
MLKGGTAKVATFVRSRSPETPELLVPLVPFHPPVGFKLFERAPDLSPSQAYLVRRNNSKRTLTVPTFPVMVLQPVPNFDGVGRTFQQLRAKRAGLACPRINRGLSNRSAEIN